MNLAATIKSEMLATLMAALDSPEVLAPGQTLTGRVLSIGEGGLTRLLVAGREVEVKLAAPAGGTSRPVQAGSTITVRIEGDAGSVPQGAGAAAGDIGRGAAPALSGHASNMPHGGLAQAARGAGPNVPASTMAAPSAVPAPPAAPSPVVPPAGQAALLREVAAATAVALGRQSGLSPLLANLTSVASAGPQSGWPDEAVQAAKRILSLTLPGGSGPSAEALRKAVAQSGVMLEARLAAGSPTDLGLAARDLKTQLLGLVRALPAEGAEPAARTAGPANVLAALEAPAAVLRPPPPWREAGPRPQVPELPGFLADPASDPAGIETVVRQAEGALERVKLLQFASLPPAETTTAPDGTKAQRWFVEVPLALDGRHGVLPMRIEQEPPRKGTAAGDGAIWRLRFALDGEPLGPLHALVTWQLRQAERRNPVAVTIWAERDATRLALRQAAPALSSALVVTGLDPTAIDILSGQPGDTAPPAGAFVDRRS